jgi:hypothetical protein
MHWDIKSAERLNSVASDWIWGSIGEECESLRYRNLGPRRGMGELVVVAGDGVPLVLVSTASREVGLARGVDVRDGECCDDRGGGSTVLRERGSSGKSCWARSLIVM